jgi:dTDP-4-amino-4,6-dideoxygalactose transaminase
VINVTKTFLPPLHEYTGYLEKIWESGWVTNDGPLVKRLERELKEYLGVKHLFFMTNGTVALQIALKALGLSGEIITTPFSYVATTSSIVWEGLKPVFVDITPDTLCIDPKLVEAAITPETTAILATHVYGNACDVRLLENIAERHNIKLIYDAAHSFGTLCCNRSVMTFGDISTLSFHATKLFHTIEGGAIITNDDATAHKVSYMRKFGHDGPEAYSGLGINGKNSELHAAMGLCILPRIPAFIEERRNICLQYDQLMADLPVRRPDMHNEINYNYAYYPIIFDSEQLLKRVVSQLTEHDIVPRRYFFPSLNKLPYVNKQLMPVSEDIAARILCLPLYNGLETKSVTRISDIIRQELTK